MQPIKNVKRCIIIVSAGIGFTVCGSKAFAQPPQGPPPPPPSPVEVFKKINPFKKKGKKDTAKAIVPPPVPGKTPSTGPGTPPPPPPNPLDLFKKKKDTARRATPTRQL